MLAISFSISVLTQSALGVAINQTNNIGANVFIHGGNGSTGYADLNVINATHGQLINQTLSNFTCSGRQCNFTVTIDNDLFNTTNGTFKITNFTRVTGIYYNASDNTWRNITELPSLGQGSYWNWTRNSSQVTLVNYTLAGGDGYDNGIRDSLAGGSYWLDENGRSLETGLVGYWKFSEGSGYSYTNDSSGYGNTGTLTNMNTTGNFTSGWNSTDCRFGSCLKFDGSDDYVNIPHSSTLNPTNQITISAWINSKSINYATSAIARKGSQYIFSLLQSTGKLRAQVTIGGSLQDVSANTVLQNNTWYHVVYTYDGSNQRIYLNGVSDMIPSAVTGIMGSDTSDLMIGKNDGYAEYFNGTIDDVRVYNRALSADEIKRLYESAPIKLQTDFLTARMEPYIQLNLTNSSDSTIFSQAAESIKIDNSPITTNYPVNSSTTYFFDWKDSDWKVWQKNNYNDALVGWWKFDEGQGVNTTDSSGKGNIGMLTNMNNTGNNMNNSVPSGWTTGKFGNGLGFDGINDYVIIPHSSSLNLGATTDSYSIEFWMKSTQNTSTWFLSKYSSGGTTIPFYFNLNNIIVNRVNFRIWDGTNAPTATSSVNVNDNSWHDIVGVRDAGSHTLKIYVDGVLSNSTIDTTTGTTANTRDISIGNDTVAGTPTHFNGTIDDVKIYSRALSAEEIKSDYLNSKRGMPDWTDPRFKQEFKWREVFDNITTTTPQVNFTYLMTAADPFVRIFVDAKNATSSASNNITIPVSLGQTKNAKYTPYEGLVGFWKFNDVTGSSTAIDSSGNGNTGTLGNGTAGTQPSWTTNCKYGSSCLNFNGIANFVDVPNSAALNPSVVTIEAWVYVNNTAHQYIILDKSWDVYALYVGIDGRLGFGMRNATVNFNQISSSLTVSSSQWYHIAASYNGTHVIFYRNGQPDVQTFNYGTLYTADTDHVSIGMRYEDGSGPLNGTIDNVKIYNRPLTAEEVKWEYLATKDDYAGNYFFNNNTNDQILFSTKNWKDKSTYNFTANVGSAAGATNNITHTYIFNSTSNNNFLFTLGYTGSISTINFDANSQKLGFSNETLEQVAQSTLTYYDLKDNKLIGWWKFNDGPGSTLATDSSGWNNTGTLTNMNVTGNTTSGWMTNSSCKFGSCLIFDGVDDYVNAGNASSLNPTATISASAWIYPTSNSAYYVIASKTADDGSYGWEFANSNGISRATLRGPVLDVSAGALTTNTWSFVAFTYDGATLRLYLNGVQTTNAAGAVTLNGINPLAIGARYSNFANKFSGAIDNVKIYSRALTAEEIKSEYFATADNYPNWAKADTANTGNVNITHAVPASWNYDGGATGIWKFDEGSGLTAIDGSGNGNTGFFVNASNILWSSGSNCKYGSCLSFNGSYSYVNAGNASILNFANKATIELWVKFNQLGVRQSPYGKISPNQYWSFLKESDNKFYMAFNIGGVETGLGSNTALQAGQWYHAIITYDGSVENLYINGNFEGSRSANGNIDSGTNNLTIGNYYTLSNPVNGTIDEFRIYPRTLTATEIYDHYSNGVSKYYDEFNAGAKRNYGIEDSTTNLQPITPSGTVLHYRFNDNSTINVTDSSGYGNNGLSANGAVWISNSSCMNNFGGCMGFDGSNDYVSVANSTSLNNITNAITVSAWIKSSVGVSGLGAITKGPMINDYDYMLYLTSSGNTVLFYIKNSVGTADSTNGASFNWADGKWHHYASVFDGSGLYVYIDGTLRDSKSTSLTNIRSSNNPLYIGTGWGASLTGMTDEVMIINRSMSADEIYQLYQGGYNRHTGDLVGWWKFNDGNNSLNALDSSGNGNTGTLNGMTTNATELLSGWNSTDCKLGKCLKFDGINDYIDAGNASSLNPSYMTAEAWIYPISQRLVDTENEARFIEKRIYANNQGYLLTWYNNSNQIGFSIGNGSAWNTAYSGTDSVQINRWSHVVGAYDGNSIKIYINGNLMNTVIHPGTIAPSTDKLSIGASDDASNRFNGTIDNVKIYNRALTADEVYEEYKQTQDQYSMYSYQHRVASADDLNSISYNLTDKDLSTQQNYDQRKLLIAGDMPQVLFNLNNANSTSDYRAKRGDFVNMYFADSTDVRPNISASLVFPNGTSSQLQLNDNLVGWWKFNEGSGSSATDSSVNGNTGTLTNMNNTGNNMNGLIASGWTTGKYGSALGFDGVDDYVNVPNSNSLNPNSRITISTWIYPIYYADGFAIFKGTYTTFPFPLTTIQYHLGTYNGSSQTIGATFEMKFTDETVEMHTDGNAIQMNAWSNLAATYDGNGMNIYVNGNLVKTQSKPGKTLDSTIGDFYIGTNKAQVTSPFNGTIDNVKIFNRALTPSEIAADYSRESGYYYSTNYSFTKNDPPGQYMVNATDDTYFTNATNDTMSNNIILTLESPKMNEVRKIISKIRQDVYTFGKAYYDSDSTTVNSTIMNASYAANSITTLLGTNTTNATGDYMFTFNFNYPTNMSYIVAINDTNNNQGSNSTIVMFLTKPLFVKFVDAYRIGTSKTNDAWRLGTSGLWNFSVGASNANTRMDASNLTRTYICTYDQAEYANGIFSSLIHTGDKRYLEYVNFSNSAGDDFYRTEIKQQMDGSSALLGFGKGTCADVDNRLATVSGQTIPNIPIGTYPQLGDLTTTKVQISLQYDKLVINGSGRFETGDNKLCMKKVKITAGNEPMIDVSAC